MSRIQFLKDSCTGIQPQLVRCTLELASINEKVSFCADYRYISEDNHLVMAILSPMIWEKSYELSNIKLLNKEGEY